jgi:hypothetical protein
MSKHMGKITDAQ